MKKYNFDDLVENFDLNKFIKYLDKQCNYRQKQTEIKYKHSCLINFFNVIKPIFYYGPVAQLVRAHHS